MSWNFQTFLQTSKIFLKKFKSLQMSKKKFGQDFSFFQRKLKFCNWKGYLCVFKVCQYFYDVKNFKQFLTLAIFSNIKFSKFFCKHQNCFSTSLSLSKVWILFKVNYSWILLSLISNFKDQTKFIRSKLYQKSKYF